MSAETSYKLTLLVIFNCEEQYKRRAAKDRESGTKSRQTLNTRYDPLFLLLQVIPLINVGFLKDDDNVTETVLSATATIGSVIVHLIFSMDIELFNLVVICTDF